MIYALDIPVSSIDFLETKKKGGSVLVYLNEAVSQDSFMALVRFVLI